MLFFHRGLLLKKKASKVENFKILYSLLVDLQGKRNKFARSSAGKGNKFARTCRGKGTSLIEDVDEKEELCS